MAINLVRFSSSVGQGWGVALAGGISPLAGAYPTTGSLIEGGAEDWRSAAAKAPSVEYGTAQLLSPVTAPCRIFCQGANYRQHMIESGLNPDDKRFNMFFAKSDASLAPPAGEVVRPPHVRLLDYEIELALIFKKEVNAPTSVTPANLFDYVFAATIANDISARDVQLPQTQFFKGKSYRGFCPIGPYLAVLEPNEFGLLDDLSMRLCVNGAVRQEDNTANLVFKPAETISELSTFANIAPGVVLLTGTPSGCALKVPPPAVRRVLQLLPEPIFWRLFLSSQGRRAEYLKPGDRITAAIRSHDGTIDLGEQMTKVV